MLAHANALPWSDACSTKTAAWHEEVSGGGETTSTFQIRLQFCHLSDIAREESDFARLLLGVSARKPEGETDPLRTTPVLLGQAGDESRSNTLPDTLLATIDEIEELTDRAAIETDEAKETLERAIVDAISFIAKLPRTIRPLVGASEDGEVVLRWYHGGADVVVEFEGDGHFGYAFLRGDRFVPGKYEGIVKGDVPPDLVAEIEAGNA